MELQNSHYYGQFHKEDNAKRGTRQGAEVRRENLFFTAPLIPSVDRPAAECRRGFTITQKPAKTYAMRIRHKWQTADQCPNIKISEANPW